MVEILAERDKDGIVRTADGVQIQIPKNRSMLAFLANGVISDTVYAEDGWVYKDDSKVKKWFIKIENHNIWEPSLLDLSTLERRRINVVINCKELIRKAWEEGVKELRRVKVSVIKRGKHYAKIEYDEKEGSVGWRWLRDNDPVPRRQLNVKAGRLYFAADTSIMRYSKYQFIFNQAFLRAAQNYIYHNNLIRNGTFDVQRYIQLVINDRDYWFDISNGVTPMIYPEDYVDKVSLAVIS